MYTLACTYESIYVSMIYYKSKFQLDYLLFFFLVKKLILISIISPAQSTGLIRINFFTREKKGNLIETVKIPLQ